MLENIGNEIWVAEHDFKMGAIDFGGRMTVIRLEDGSLLLYSVIAIDDALAEELAALGEVKHLVGPNSLHHLFLDDAIARYPDAKVYGPKALRDKRSELEFHVALEHGAPWPELPMLVMEGAPQVDEVVLYHPASKTLVMCDLCFNIHEARGWFSPLFFRMLGVWKKVKQSPLWRFALTKDRAAAERSLAPMWAWDFERVVISHGRLIEGPNAKQRLARGMRWMCGGEAKALPSGNTALRA